jgi:hypothetical protein
VHTHTHILLSNVISECASTIHTYTHSFTHTCTYTIHTLCTYTIDMLLLILFLIMVMSSHLQSCFPCFTTRRQATAPEDQCSMATQNKKNTHQLSRNQVGMTTSATSSSPISSSSSTSPRIGTFTTHVTLLATLEARATSSSSAAAASTTTAATT